MDLSFLELENGWPPIIWLFSAGLLVCLMPRKQELVEGEVASRWYWFSALLLTIPLILWSGARGYVADTTAYIKHFNNAPDSLAGLIGYLPTVNKDKGFTVLMTVCKMLGLSTYQSFFMLIAALQMWCMIYTFRRYSTDFWTCIFIFVAATDYDSWMFNGMRQFIAVCMIFAAFRLMVEKKHIWFCLIVILAAQIHGSAIIMLPLAYIMHGPALNQKTILMILGVSVLVPFIDQFMPFLEELLSDTQYGDITSNEIWTNDDGTNIIRVAVYSVPALLAFVGRKYILQANNPVMNLCINASMITMAIYVVSSVTSGIYIGRLPIYTTLHGYIALPWMLDRIFEKRSARLIKCLMIAFYFAFYYYSVFMR